MTALDFIYHVIHYGNLSKDATDRRFNAAAVVAWASFPTINACLGLLLGLSQDRTPINPGSEVLYARYDIWTYISIVLSGLVGWLLFDKRRANILRRYNDFTPSRKIYWCTAAIAFSFIFFSTYLSMFNYLATVLFSCVTLAAGGLLTQRIVTRSDKSR